MAKVFPFILGAAVGAAGALLLAPQTGEQTRALVTEKANAVVGEAKDFGAGFPGSAQDILKTAQDKGASFVGAATAKGQDLVSDAQSRVNAAAPAEVDADDLRQKIEAARQRIAAQVMENAEQSKAVEVEADMEDEDVADVVETAKHAAVEEAAPEAE